uniref:Piwi domain-containing protein n=1 Tax=Leersia perrieri TaxID=77586 RepID=A0A0D9WWC8_9ORYZ
MAVAGGGNPHAAAPIPLSSKGVAPPSRPGYGAVGDRIVVRANHFLVRVADSDMIYLYDVNMNPTPKTRHINRVVISELAKLHREAHLGGLSFAYDGSKALYTAGKLPFESMDFKIKLGKDLREIEYKVTIRLAGQADLHHLHEFIAGRQRDSQQQTIQALDVVLRESPSLNYVTVYRSFFSTAFGREDIGDGLESWKGYYQSLRPTQMGLSLNIDISSTAFFKPISVVEYVKNCLSRPDPRRPLSDIDRLKLKKALRGIRVETTHQQGKSSKYKITTITSDPLSQLNFPLDGATQTVVQYFSERYKYRLHYTSWPCLQSGSASSPIYLPMEVCTIIEGQRYFKKLNENQVTGLLKATCLPPQKREQKISEMVQHNNYPADRVVREFKIDISNQMATVPARVLPAPMLRYHDSGKEKTCYPRVGQWSMMNKKMVDGAKVQKWTCVSFARMQMDAVHRLCGELIYTCNATGMHFNQWPVMEVHSASPDNIEAALKNIHSVAPELELLIVILPDNSGYYGRIKRVCETELGIVSQCLKPGRKLWSFDRKYLENVSLKINVKTGGRNVVLQRPLLPGGLEDPTIIFGADVTHPAPGEDSAASIAAVVASMDWPEVTKYRALVSAQPARQEIIQDLFTMTETPLNTGCQQKADAQKKNIVCGGMIRDLLMAFYSKNAKRKPKRIIFYRDGVSDGQFYQVLLYEMDAIKKVIASMDSTYKPLVTFVVVQKRHHTRLFPEVHGRQDLTDKSGNIRPGTVVDTNICHPSEFDF